MISDFTKERPRLQKAMSCREVRMWHWQRVMNYRATARKHMAQIDLMEKEGKGQKAIRNVASLARQANGRADFHLKCVQAMNDIPSLLGTTAEYDCARFEGNVASPY